MAIENWDETGLGIRFNSETDPSRAKSILRQSLMVLTEGDYIVEVLENVWVATMATDFEDQSLIVYAHVWKKLGGSQAEWGAGLIELSECDVPGSRYDIARGMRFEISVGRPRQNITTVRYIEGE